MKKYGKLSIFSLVFCAIVATFVFQNCGKIDVTPFVENSYSTTALNGEFCSLAALSEDTFINLIFIVDMSGSNVRKLNGTTFVAAGATDPTGIRFKMIRDFVNSSCISDKSKARFSVVGFSADVTPLTTACEKDHLVSNTEVDSQINYLENIQSSEPKPPNQGTVAMRGTVYEKSLNCAASSIQSHVASLSDVDKKKNMYHVMFLSDGAPSDSLGYPITNFSAIYSAITNIKNNGKAAAGAIVQPILYGANLMSSTELTSATAIMTEMAKRGDSIQSAVQDPSQINFCDLFRTGRRTPYVVSAFGAINLTAIMKNGRLLPDSDMDGIPDEEEKTRGFNPAMARSFINGNQLLDGVCRFNADQCAPHTCGEPNIFSLTDCETTELSLLDGVDTDIDSIPDFVEFLKGTLASQDDINSDNDGDGVINGKELLTGRDPNYSDGGIDYRNTMDVTRLRSKIATSACPSNQERWMFSAKNIPLVATIATTSDPLDTITPKTLWRSHLAGENIILVYYTVQEQNEMATVPPVIYGKFFKIVEGQSIRLENFEKLGVIDGIFKPLH